MCGIYTHNRVWPRQFFQIVREVNQPREISKCERVRVRRVPASRRCCCIYIHTSASLKTSFSSASLLFCVSLSSILTRSLSLRASRLSLTLSLSCARALFVLLLFRINNPMLHKDERARTVLALVEGNLES